MFEAQKQRKINRKKEEALYKQNLEEQQILETEKQIRGDENFIKGVVDRMNEDANRRKLGIDKKCKIEHHSDYYNNNLSTRTSKFDNAFSNLNNDSSIKNFKKKILETSKNYIFKVNSFI